MARKKSLAQWLREANAKSKVEKGPMWVIKLDFPVTDVFCERTPTLNTKDHGPDDVRDDIGFMAAMFAQRIKFELLDTDNDSIILVRSDRPWEVLCLREEFMPPVMKALRRSGIHGIYYKSGTLLKYEF